MLTHLDPGRPPEDAIVPVACVLAFLAELTTQAPPGRELDLSNDATEGMGMLLHCLADTLNAALDGGR
ncbi:MAG: hypothetical protein AB1578_19035 [Thermodesulfobacteriota bacterium]